MKKTALTLFFGFLFGFVVIVYAAEPNITFPIPELGNCKDKTECRAYCDQKDHIQACIEFAKSHGLISQHEADKAQKLRQLPPEGGPGGCKDIEACKTYCQASEHAQECIQFAKDHGLMDEKEAQEANRILATLAQRGLKMPGGCTSKDACEAYCHVQEHFDECLNFAKSAGFVTEQQAQVIKQTQGKGPGGCQGQEACKQYCADQSHFQECVVFAKEHGLITDKEQQMMEKTQGKGPGGCTDQEECKQFCSDPVNHDVCLNFAKEHGLMDESQNQNGSASTDNSQGQNVTRRLPEPVIACMRKNLGDDVVTKFLSAPGEPPVEIRDKIQACYDEWSKLQQQTDIQERQGQTAFNPNAQGQSNTAPSPVGQRNFTIPESVMACLRASVGEEMAQEIAQGQTQLEGDIKIKAQVCFAKANEQKNTPSTTQAAPVACAQVLTSARNPASNICRVFPNPCVVPLNWVKVERCETSATSQGSQTNAVGSTTNVLPSGSTNQNYIRFCQEHPESCPHPVAPMPAVPLTNPPASEHSGSSESSSTLQNFGATLIHTLYFFVGGR